MLDILEPYAGPMHEALPPHWRSVAMPAAPWYLLVDGRLQPLDGGASLATAAALNAALDAAAPAATVVAQQDAVVWRLRRSAQALPLWAAQRLSDSRERLYVRLRCLLAGRLAPQVLHELRNPMNALSLHADLLARLIAMPDAAERAGNSARIVRERLRDLAARHDALVALWLSVPDAAGAPMAQLVDGALRLVRSYGTVHEIRLLADGLEALEACRQPRRAAAVEIAFIAILLIACAALPTTQERATRELRIDVTPAPDAVELRVPLALPAEQAVSGLDWDGDSSRCGELLDACTLLLDDEPLRLQIEPDGVRLRFATG